LRISRHDDPGVCALRAVKHDRQMRDLERTSETRKYFCYARFGRARRIYERDRRTTRLLDAGQGRATTISFAFVTARVNIADGRYRAHGFGSQ
jgi:Tfp pilus assembly protein PilF